MTSKSESDKKFLFSFVSIIASIVLGLFYLTVTPRKGQLRKCAVGLSCKDRSSYYSKVDVFNTYST